jgi:hypothetical protein
MSLSLQGVMTGTPGGFCAGGKSMLNRGGVKLLDPRLRGDDGLKRYGGDEGLEYGVMRY